MPKADTRHLYKRGQWWWLKVRIPGTKRIHRQPLKTKNLGEAQILRNQLLEEQRWLIDRHDYAVRLKQLREEYLDSVDEGEREILREEIIESSEDMAADLGILELYKGPHRSNLDLMTEKELGPWKAYKTAVGELTPIELVKSDWLETIENKKTRSDYRRGLEVLQKRFVTIEEITHSKADHFFEWAKQNEKVRNPTIRKWKGGYVNLWHFLKKDPSIWGEHRLSKDAQNVSKEPWSIREVITMYRILSDRNDKVASWLKHAVWIAAHTGAREGAISNLKYDPDNQTIHFPKAKFEKNDRLVPAHPEIQTNLYEWENGCRRSASSISSQFTNFKHSLGYETQKDFHSFRRTFTTMCENSGIPENVTADIVGHKKSTMTYGLYSGGSSIDVMRKYIKLIDYGLEELN